MEGGFNGGFLVLPVWGTYTWRGLFSEFYGILRKYHIRDEQSKLNTIN